MSRSCLLLLRGEIYHNILLPGLGWYHPIFRIKQRLEINSKYIQGKQRERIRRMAKQYHSCWQGNPKKKIVEILGPMRLYNYYLLGLIDWHWNTMWLSYMTAETGAAFIKVSHLVSLCLNWMMFLLCKCSWPQYSLSVFTPIVWYTNALKIIWAQPYPDKMELFIQLCG